MMTKQQYALDCKDRAVAIKAILATRKQGEKRTVSPADLEAYYAERSEHESEQRAERAQEQYDERRSEPWASDQELMSMMPPPEDDWRPA